MLKGSVILRHSMCSHRASGAKSRTVSIGHIARSCCYVVPVALLNKELRRQYCDMDVRSGIDLR